MSVRLVEDVKIQGVSAFGVFGDQVISARTVQGVAIEPTLELTLADRADMWLTERARDLFNAGTVITYRDEVYQLTNLTVGGGTEAPTLTVAATMDSIVRLKDHKKAESWNTTSVSQWAENQIERFLATAIVQEDLGDRTIEQQADDQTPENGESRWDVLAETAKKVGAWVFGVDDTIILGKPSWLARRRDASTLKLKWDSWTDHSDALIEAPLYTWEHELKSWEGQERLELTLMDPVDSDGPLMGLRPGDIVNFTGRAVPSPDPVWLVYEVERPLVVGYPAKVTCWRPIDPPEIAEDTGAGSGEVTAGVPTGPLGKYGWKGKQLENAAAIVKEGQRRGLEDIAIVMALMTAMQESKLEILNYGDDIHGVTNPNGTPTTSKGLFQQQDPWGPLAVRMSATGSAGLFYDRLADFPQYKQAKDAMTASRVINLVQVSNFPDAYAQWWDDAHTVYKACVEANKAAVAGDKHTGPLGARIDRIMGQLDGGPNIDLDGNGAWCVDLADKYIEMLTGIPGSSIMGNGIDYWRHPQLMSKFTPIANGMPMKKGDIITWGANSIYRNVIDGVICGHVAIYAHHTGGSAHFLTQNPLSPKIMFLNPIGILGYMRPKGP